jgi:putative DNA-invertase from lambdoid prophage Rac
MVGFPIFQGGFVSPMRAALYARVSTHDQQTLAMQIDAMHEFATRRGWTIIATVEEIASGAKDRRPKRHALLTAAKQRKLDVILVWKLDRWGRSLVDLMTTLHELTALGVGFVSLTETLDLTTPAGRAFAGFLAGRVPQSCG